MPTKTPNDATLQSTKQMLDELDALMEKMLSMPVNESEAAPPFPGEVVKPPTLTPTLSATLTLLEPPAKGPLKPLEPAQQESYAPAHAAINPPHLTPPTPQPEPLTNEVTPPSMMHRLAPMLEEIPEPETAVTTQLVYLPLLWINLAFDQATLALGPIGSMLRSRAGRALLGLAGLALLAAAAGWFLKDWLGWNQ
jgi:hypothetical protein